MTAKDEATRLRLHVFPLIGHMALAEVRPRHIRDLINAIKQKTSDAPKCKGERLAPRTVRLVYATLRLMFKTGSIDDPAGQEGEDYGHGDLLFGTDAPDLVWKPLASWLLAH